MARGSKVTINRRNADAIALAIHDGVFALGVNIIERARPPDLPPMGVGLVEQGGVIGYVDGKKVADSSTGRAIRKPRGYSTPKGKIVVIGGYGFPAHLVEYGSIHNTPHPFLMPAISAGAAEGAMIMAGITRPKVESIR